MTLSTPMLSVAGMGRRDTATRDSATDLMAASGRRRAASGSASTRSRSICVDDSTPLMRGCRPNVTLALPLSLIALSSGPYWNSICSNTAAALSPLTRLVRRHGIDDERLGARGRPTDRAGELNAAVEARRAALDPDRDVRFGVQRAAIGSTVSRTLAPLSSAMRLVETR